MLLYFYSWFFFFLAVPNNQMISYKLKYHADNRFLSDSHWLLLVVAAHSAGFIAETFKRGWGYWCIRDRLQTENVQETERSAQGFSTGGGFTYPQNKSVTAKRTYISLPFMHDCPCSTSSNATFRHFIYEAIFVTMKSPVGAPIPVAIVTLISGWRN